MLRSAVLFLALACPTLTFAEATQLPAGSAYEVGFSPSGKSLELVLKAINSAQSDILVAAYSFTSKPIALALLEAQRRGVSVMVVADEKDNVKKYSAVTFLANSGVAVRLNGNYAIHHHKFMVIDGDSVETGSFNYSEAAVKKNAENALVIWHAPSLALTYTQEWHRLWDESAELAPRY